MTDTIPIPISSDLANQLRRWIIIVGYVLGGWEFLHFVLGFVAWGSPFAHGVGSGILDPAYRVATACILVSPLLLISGCWGFQRHKRWARAILFTYAGAWVGGIFAKQAIEIITLFSWPSDLSSRQKFGVALGDFDYFVYGSVYAVALVLCLTRSGIKDTSLTSGGDLPL